VRSRPSIKSHWTLVCSFISFYSRCHCTFLISLKKITAAAENKKLAATIAELQSKIQSLEKTIEGEKQKTEAANLKIKETEKAKTEVEVLNSFTFIINFFQLLVC
jgi:septal ring factor EnvC (AmiA/AmiB activator)